MMDTAMLPDLLRYDDLAAEGLTRHGLDRLIESGDFERIAPGLFLRAGLTDDTTAAWMAVAAKKPDAPWCPLPALAASMDWLHSAGNSNKRMVCPVGAVSKMTWS